MSEIKIDQLINRIRDIPDFPKPGIIFKDITPLLADPSAFCTCLQLFEDKFRDRNIEVIAGIESRGFIFGAALATKIKIPFVPVRKPGKLPAETYRVDYQLEYGTDALEIHRDAITKGARVLIVDDLLATGGTAKAASELVTKAGGNVVSIAFVIELSFLDGVKNLPGIETYSLIKY